ncbi:uncharacterized protein [Primulina huaijiensis]|uniref:uncharacterized protein n=1 Tax=Primulina huaijiensis TaxID=1492673 RepID=UPI003CC73BBC
MRESFNSGDASVEKREKMVVTGKRDGDEDDKLAHAPLLQAIAYACKVPATFTLELTDSEVPKESEIQFDEDQELEKLINGQICYMVYPFLNGIYGLNILKSERKIILSGSFNPLHYGNIKLLEVAMSYLQRDGYPCFELSAVNANQPPLTVYQIKERVRQFEKAEKTVIISNQPYFCKKAELSPGSAFVNGADTAARLINPKYYGGDYGKNVKLLCGCKNKGCLFLVGDRNADGVFTVLDDLDIPEQLNDMFISIPAKQFRTDISSTEIRKNL